MRAFHDDCIPSYHQRIDHYKKIYKNLNNDRYWEKFYKCVPLNWSQEGRNLLSSFKLLVDNHLFEVHKNMVDLRVALSSAVMKDRFSLDKNTSVNNDLLDATLAAAREFSYRSQNNVD